MVVCEDGEDMLAEVDRMEVIDMKRLMGMNFLAHFLLDILLLRGVLEPFDRGWETFDVDIASTCSKIRSGSRTVFEKMVRRPLSLGEASLLGAFGQLDDGRAITLGEIINSSEARHGQGIPTTRALYLVTIGKYVTRDIFYGDNLKEKPRAIVCRVAQSFIIFGLYQIHTSRRKRELGIIRALADYVIRHHFPRIENMNRSESLSFGKHHEGHSVVDLTSNTYATWAVEVPERTATLSASWQGVGFTHGVLNTDNMSIWGLSIDYGSFGFLDAFDLSYTPNTTDLPGRRYYFANQLDMGL
ncbi:protein adenylyltransferase SelO-like [Juglans microcarpa x Juglans regia]|uniref:protein adenylyltransferase SelO-like n=1 Tax=Juglans microcarpa x Juglans regia TaxID=2249226 RepID=UPI001B7F6935|nr:protein adenylyltransferase SelO-like [Juglans microcarpa x Juglans regia]